jgi:hypothetical protein
MGHHYFVVGGLRVSWKLGAMPGGQAKAPGRVILAGQALAEEPDEVCPTKTTGQAEIFRRGEANPTKGVNRDRKSQPSMFWGFAEGW